VNPGVERHVATAVERPSVTPHRSGYTSFIPDLPRSAEDLLDTVERRVLTRQDGRIWCDRRKGALGLSSRREDRIAPLASQGDRVPWADSGQVSSQAIWISQAKCARAPLTDRQSGLVTTRKAARADL
jgi:hypothetical protein